MSQAVCTSKFTISAESLEDRRNRVRPVAELYTHQAFNACNKIFVYEQSMGHSRPQKRSVRALAAVIYCGMGCRVDPPEALRSKFEGRRQLQEGNSKNPFRILTFFNRGKNSIQQENKYSVPRDGFHVKNKDKCTR
uniref:Uncharacterized protein n=1 Tax=Anguilla anguilla TaxID=7936 RepID=A0A0E9X9K8_ANGAN